MSARKETLDSVTVSTRRLTEVHPMVRRARQAFDTITEASYYGMRFRQILATNPEALKAAEVLAEFVKSEVTQGPAS